MSLTLTITPVQPGDANGAAVQLQIINAALAILNQQLGLVANVNPGPPGDVLRGTLQSITQNANAIAATAASWGNRQK